MEMDVGEGKELRRARADRFFALIREEEKRGVPRHHGNMLPGNSFPQICVVSVHRIEDIALSPQEYLRVLALSNRYYLLLGN
jgi:hypothetical protein